MSRQTIHFVPSTHWDREWYRVLGEFQFHFAELMDRALALLRAGKLQCYHVDGQSSVIEDYLEVRPQARAVLRRLARQGRLELGPWYTQGDMLLPSGESLIRNLEMGLEHARSLGAPPGIPYSPDAFGHSADVPKILRHLGFDTYFFCRGLGEQMKPLRSEFRWRASDGSEILAIAGVSDVFDPPHDVRGRWICGAYALGMELPEDAAAFAERVRLILAHATGYATTGEILAINGSDHLLPQAHAAEAIARFNRAGSSTRCVQGTLGDYVRALRVAGAERRAPVVTGELADGRIYWILAGTGSSRAGQKRANWRCQQLLEGWVEPWNAFLPVAARRSQSAFIRKSWKLLLQNQAHDSFCGCGIDAVHREMDARFETIERLGARLLLRSVRRVAGDPKLQNPAPAADAAAFPLLLCSGLPWPETGPWSVRVPHPVGMDLRKYDFLDRNGRAVPVAIGARGPADDINGPYLPSGPHSVCLASTSVVLDAVDLPAYGYHILECRRRPVSARDPAPASGAPAKPALENERLRVTLDPGGTLTAVFRHGKKTTRFARLLEFEDEADVGGEYDFRPLAGDRVLRPSARAVAWRWQAWTPAFQVLQVDRWLDCPLVADRTAGRRSAKKVRLRIRNTLTLRRGSAGLEVRTEIDNVCRDHRLRVAFPLPFRIRQYEAQTPFGRLVHRLRLPEGKGWRQPPSRCRRQYGWLAFRDPESGLGLALLPQGIHEHEAGESSARLTLLRCVGEIGEGGPALSAPDAQCPGAQICEYALRFLDPATDSPVALEREMARLSRPPRAWALHPEAMPARADRAASFLELRAKGLVITSVRAGAAPGSLLVRVLNPTSRAASGTFVSDSALRGVRPIRSDSPGASRRGPARASSRITVPPHGLALFELEVAPEARVS
jgi:alpha-mannosidase